MNQEILELLAEKKYSAVKQLIGQMEEADLAKLFEELENEEDADQFNRLFRLLLLQARPKEFRHQRIHFLTLQVCRSLS